MSRYDAVHRNPQGPGDDRPTAIQIIQDEGLTGMLEGKVAFITGANRGIGLETARAIHTTGATVYLGVRDLASGQQAIDDIAASNPDSKGVLHLVELSLDSLASVRKCAKSFLAQTNTLNVLILNAAAMSETREQTVDGFEKVFATNHLGHHLLFHLLKPALLASSTLERHSRVVSVSSQVHRATEIRFGDLNFEKGYDRLVAYSHSKLANVYLANEIERRYGSRGVHGLSLHPGLIITNINRDSLEGAQSRKRPALGGRYNELKPLVKSTSQGAATTVYAALSAEWEGRGGKYLNDCEEAGPVNPGSHLFSSDAGYTPWAFDEDKAARLWVESNRMVGLPGDS
ncbi:ww domain-containing oxidoreductase [Colletotrichum sojae]|uniref:Ww domain-containing oxidoreductase n=1 Tax=Colletotrichum sojae TaxID=2175907 RepID=A0A8H6IMH2_9PEZI|nr:ww domain-containing oxidoreductase [Colletotrichum sojae]